jgi:hypothetical protein
LGIDMMNTCRCGHAEKCRSTRAASSLQRNAMRMRHPVR